MSVESKNIIKVQRWKGFCARMYCIFEKYLLKTSILNPKYTFF